jgi:hypothetical protein
MQRDLQQSMRLIFSLTGQILSRPAWLMTLFLFLACLVPFAGGTSPFRGDAYQILDPFSFSLLTPTTGAFGPHAAFALAGLFIIPAVLIFWRRKINMGRALGTPCGVAANALPGAALVLYCLFVLVGLPLVAKSSAFPNISSLGITVLDLVLLGASLALFTDFALSRTSQPRLQPLVGWMIAGAVYLARCMSDIFLIAPGARELVEADWTLIVWHAILVVVALTLYAFSGPEHRTSATISS